ncbi:MAG: hypothetical protein HYV62_12495 [Candidatus Rokubacteria bacterium]|nr:hypothetical protein [Candidatus Rokubacteria bacterium]
MKTVDLGSPSSTSNPPSGSRRLLGVPEGELIAHAVYGALLGGLAGTARRPSNG